MKGRLSIKANSAPFDDTYEALSRHLSVFVLKVSYINEGDDLI